MLIDKLRQKKLLALFVNLTSRVLHAVYSAHASATLCLSPPAGSSCRDTQGTLGDSPLVAGGGWSWRMTMILICRFSETIPIAIGKFLAATSCSYLQQPSLSPAPHLPNSQVPSPGGPEAVVPLVPAGAAPAAWSPLFYAAAQGQQAARSAPQAC